MERITRRNSHEGCRRNEQYFNSEQLCHYPKQAAAAVVVSSQASLDTKSKIKCRRADLSIMSKAEVELIVEIRRN